MRGLMAVGTAFAVSWWAYGATDVDCSRELPDAGLGRLTFGVVELSAETGTGREVSSVDFADARTFGPDRGDARYQVHAEEAVPFVRLGENRRWGYGFGVRPKEAVAAAPGSTFDIRFEGRVPAHDCTYALYVVVFGAKGENVTPKTSVPAGWTYSPYSKAFYVAPVELAATNRWQEKSFVFVQPEGAASFAPVMTSMRGQWTDCRALSVRETGVCRRTAARFSRRTEDGAGNVTLTDEAAQLSLETSVEKTVGAGIVRVRIADTAVPPRPRALQVTVTWARGLVGWTWHRDWRRDEPLTAGSEFRDEEGLAGHPVGRYPFSAVSRGGKGVLLGTGFDGPVYESRVVTDAGIVSTVHVGLLARGGVGTSADLHWLVQPFEGAWGFRSAAKAYYASQAHKLLPPAKGAKEGTWVWPTPPSVLPENPDDFGLAFWESTHVTSNEVGVARRLGIGVFPYTEANGMRQTMKGKTKGDLPPVEDRLAELKGWAAEENLRVRWFDAPRNVAAQACLNSMPVQPDGTHPFSVDNYGAWMHWWRTNPDPRIAKPNRASICWDYVLSKCIGNADGVYLDSLTAEACGFSNVRSDHLAVMTEPLVYDPATARPCANGMQHMLAFVRGLAETLHPQGKRLFGNVFDVAYRFYATSIDIMGREVGDFGNPTRRDALLRETLTDAGACLQRFYCHRRPVVNLLQTGCYHQPLPAISAAAVTNYVSEHVFYAFYPGISTIGGEDKPGYAGWRRYFDRARQCERDRALFKEAIPLIRRLNRAGWEPETLVRCADGKVLVERYGSPEGLCFLTVRNASDQVRDVTLVPDGDFAARAKALRALWHGADVPKLAATGWRARLEPWQTVVYQVEER